MFKTVYLITVRVGSYEFHKEFENEPAALVCFNSIAVPSDDVEIEGDKCTLDSTENVTNITIQRSLVPIRIGDPNR